MCQMLIALGETLAHFGKFGPEQKSYAGVAQEQQKMVNLAHVIGPASLATEIFPGNFVVRQTDAARLV